MIDIVTLSCNEDPMYWEFWNPVSKQWKEEFGIHPVLFYYGKENSLLSNEHGSIVYHDVVDGIPDYVAATWGRFWVTKFFPNKMCLISDIDMFPLSREFFLSIPNPSDEHYTHLNSGAYYGGDSSIWVNPGMGVPVCYHLANSSMLMDVYSFDESYRIELQKMLDTDYSEYTNGFANTPEPHLQRASASNGGMWGIDEMYSSIQLRRWLTSGGKFTSPSQINYTNRLCRARMGNQLVSCSQTQFVDFHSIRPYSKNKETIQSIVKAFTH